MTSFRVNTVIWDDEEFVGLSDLARTLVFLLITGPQATVLPGLQRGSVATLADALRRPVGDVHGAMGELMEAGILEHDEKRRVLRAPNAPKHNAAESPNHLKAWWKRWQEIPDCALKFEHVAALRAYAGLDQESHRKVWESTFGTVPEPKPAASVGVPPAPGQVSGRDGEALAKPSGSPPEDLPNYASASASASASADAPATPPPTPPPTRPPSEASRRPGSLPADDICSAILRGARDAFEPTAAATLKVAFAAIVNDHEVTLAELEALGREMRERPPPWVTSGRLTIPMLLGKARDGGNFTSLLSDMRSRRARASPPATAAVFDEFAPPKRAEVSRG